MFIGYDNIAVLILDSTWGLNSTGFKSCTSAWNVGVRRLLNLPNTTRTWMLGHLLDSVHKTYIRDLKLLLINMGQFMF